MDKPRYEKPIVFDLNGNTAYGDIPPLQSAADCIPGSNANQVDANCVSGGVASMDCATGSLGSKNPSRPNYPA